MIEDKIIDILINGNKTEIKNILEKFKISYNFSKKLDSHEIRINLGDKIVLERGHGFLKKPNCIKYFGYIIN